MTFLYPFVTEKATLEAEKNNALQFIVDIRANKKQIKKYIEDTYDMDVLRVNSIITMRGKKKAYVVFAKEGDAVELASRLGLF